MPSVKTKIDGEYIKIPMYTSGDADSITYNSSATHPNGTVGKELKEQSEKIVNLQSGKQNIPSQVTSGTEITLADNTEYRLTNVSTLTITYPSGNYDCWMKITTASSGNITITIPSSSYIGDAPTFGNAETWELSFKDGVVGAVKVGDGQ